MKINTHVLSQLIAEKDNSFVSLHEIESDKEDNLEITYDVIIPAKKITISKAEYRQYMINGKIDTLLSDEEH